MFKEGASYRFTFYDPIDKGYLHENGRVLEIDGTMLKISPHDGSKMQLLNTASVLFVSAKET